MPHNTVVEVTCKFHIYAVGSAWNKYCIHKRNGMASHSTFCIIGTAYGHITTYVMQKCPLWYDGALILL